MCHPLPTPLPQIIHGSLTRGASVPAAVITEVLGLGMLFSMLAKRTKISLFQLWSSCTKRDADWSVIFVVVVRLLVFLFFLFFFAPRNTRLFWLCYLRNAQSMNGSHDSNFQNICSIIFPEMTHWIFTA